MYDPVNNDIGSQQLIFGNSKFRFFTFSDNLKHTIDTEKFEEPNLKIYRCVKVDFDNRFASLNTIFHTPINLAIGLFRHQLLYNIWAVTLVR